MISTGTYLTSLFQTTRTLQNLSKSDKLSTNNTYSRNSNKTAHKWRLLDRSSLFVSSPLIAYISLKIQRIETKQIKKHI